MREPRAGTMAEFGNREAMLAALDAMWASGVRRLETFTPVPCPQVDQNLGRRPSRLPLAMLVAGLLGAAGAYGLQWLVTAFLYRVNVGGRPPHFPLAYVPITFEMGVLFASVTGFVGVIAAGRLMRLWSPVFEVEGFESASRDRYWLAVDASDPVYDADRAKQILQDRGASRVVDFGSIEDALAPAGGDQ